MFGTRSEPPPDAGSPRRLYAALAAATIVLSGLLVGLFRLMMHLRTDGGQQFMWELILVLLVLAAASCVAYTIRGHLRRRDAVEQALRASEEKLRSISEAALDAVVMMDGQGRAVHWNPAAQRMFGYTAEEVLGQNIHPLVTPARLQASWERALEEFFRSGQGPAAGRITELPALRKNGQEFPIEMSLAPIRLAGEWNAVAVIRDITERKQAEEAAGQEQHSLRRLLRAYEQERKLIAYEIHDGLAQQLVAAIYQCQAVEHAIPATPDKVGSAFRELQRLLQQCLAETRRLISGARPPVLDEMGVVSAVQALIADTQLQTAPQITFRHNVQFERLEPVLENTVYRIIQEGLTNACRHSHSSQVLITLTETDLHLEIRVQDYGIGFDPDQVDEKRFGLAGIRERTRLLGGHVTLQSAPGTGTLLIVQLPKDVGDLAGDA